MRTRRGVIAAFALGGVLALAGCDAQRERAGEASPAAMVESGPEETTARIALDRVTATPADLIELRIEWVCDSGWAPEGPGVIPAAGQELGGFEVRSSRPLEPRLSSDGRTIQGRALVLAPLTPGTYEIPSIPLAFRRIDDAGSAPRMVETSPVTVHVESLLPEGDPGGLADRKDVVEPPPAARWPWIAGGGAALCAAAAVAVALARRRAERPAPVVPEAPPAEEARAALAALLARGLPAKGEFDAYFTSLSAILRRYIERRFGLRAPRLTTDEFLHAARRDDAFRADDARELERFLRLCDTVKFARFAPGEREAGEAFDIAKGFVQRTAAEEPAAPGEAAS